jgi:hypothetical protein
VALRNPARSTLIVTGSPSPPRTFFETCSLLQSRAFFPSTSTMRSPYFSPVLGGWCCFDH